MVIDVEKLTEDYKLHPFGAKGWMGSDDLKCPYCGRSEKFGILFTDKGGVTHCFYDCGDNLSLPAYLRKIGRDDLVSKDRIISVERPLIEPIFGVREEEEVEIEEVKIPIGFKRIYYDKYLEGRGFEDYQYEQFEVGITNSPLERKLHGYLVFLVKVRGKVVGWLARSKKSKEWHAENLKEHKFNGSRLVLRYINSTGTDFEKFIGGFDEINNNTHTVIAVEGLFDKTNISALLKTEEDDGLKVICTFGNKFSDHQIKLLESTNVENVILMYDYNTVKQSKRYGLELSKHFNTEICYIDREGIDPGNIEMDYLAEVLSKRENFLYFYTNKLNFNKS